MPALTQLAKDELSHIRSRMLSSVIAEVSRGLGEAMVGINVDEIPEPHRLAERGW